MAEKGDKKNKIQIPNSLPPIPLQLFLSFGANPAEMEKENLTIPDYLPSDEEEDENPQAITRSRKSTSQGGWIKTAANFLTSSFYW